MALSRSIKSKIYEVKAHNGYVTSLELGETGRVLVTGGQDRNVNLWAIGQDTCFMSLTGHNRPIECVRFAYNDDYVYSSDDIGVIRRWDLNAQRISSTLNGHMKSVRTLDFNPSGEYIASGSCDTTVRLWDVRNDNKCIKIYRGHSNQINTVKFSPDGLWIASAGTEGSVLIWDIRKSKKIMNLANSPTGVAITCIQFHPYEFLLAVGRIDGTVNIYDLESGLLISGTDETTQFYGSPIACLNFSEKGECLFVGTALGISVIGWEPDKEFDYIKSDWKILGDMKLVNKKLICVSFDSDIICIDALSIERIFPFYNPSHQKSTFNQSSTSRKSFSKGYQKLRLSLTGSKSSSCVEECEKTATPMDDGSSPNLSLEILSEPSNIDSTTSHQPIHSLTNLVCQPVTGSRSLNTAFINITAEDYTIDKSPKYVLTNENYNSNDGVVDFSINQYPQELSSSTCIFEANKTKKSLEGRIRNNEYFCTSENTSDTTFNKSNKILHTSSFSTTDLHKLDGDSVLKSSALSSFSRNGRNKDFESNLNKENVRNKNTFTQIASKPPLRSRTSLELYSRHQHSAEFPVAMNKGINNVRKETLKVMHFDQNLENPNFFGTLNDRLDTKILEERHQKVFYELHNRHIAIKVIRDSNRCYDIISSLKLAVCDKGRALFVDLLGALLEKTSSWNLDMCLILLPEIFQLLKSQNKFHYMRACDTLRVILSNFLPIIQDNLDSWIVNGLGVDVPREERQQKCQECHYWLLQIRNLPENAHFGSTLTNLQNMMVNI